MAKRILSHAEKVAALEGGERVLQKYLRRRAMGLTILAVLIFLIWLLRMPLFWIFDSRWWHL